MSPPKPLKRSKRSDFAPTHLLPEKLYLEGAAHEKLVWGKCGCEDPQLGRLERFGWMRFVPFFRHYQCGRCGVRMFRWKVDGVNYPPTYFRNPQDPPA